MIVTPGTLLFEDCEPLPQLPLFWRVGRFPASELPVLWPADYRQGVWVQVGSKAGPVADRLLETLVMQWLLQSPPRYLSVTVYEPGLQSRLPWLDAIHRQTGGHVIHLLGDKRDIADRVAALLERARNRQVALAREGMADWQACLAAKRTAEPVEVLVMAGLWADPDLLRNLHDLVVSGGVLGILPVIQYSGLMTRHLVPEQQQEVEGLLEEMRRHSVVMAVDREGGLDLKDERLAPVCNLFRHFGPKVDEPDEAAWRKALARAVTLQQTEVEPPETSDFLEIPVGRHRGRPWPFTLGSRSRAHHALIGGVSHSGKTSFLQMLVARICARLGPSQVRLHLLDYKDGFSFGLFPGLPQVAFLQQDSRDVTGLKQVLQRYLDEMERRRQLFRAQGPGVSRLDAYNGMVSRPLPRWLMVVDEVQGALRLAGEDLPGLQASLRELAGHGGCFGLHLIFTTQTATDSLLDEATRAQFGLRIAFRPGTSAESEAFFGRVNEAALSLPPYQALFNAQDGDPDGNVRVEVDYMPEIPDLAQALDAVRERHAPHHPTPETS